MADSEDFSVRLAQELVKRRVATLQQVREALATAEELSREGKPTSAGNVLVSRGILDLENLKVILSSLGELYMACPACEIVSKIAGYDPENEYLCKACQGELVYVTQPPRRKATRTGSTGAGSRGSSPSRREARRAAADAADQTLIGRQVGGCLVRRKLASGGMGTVFEAEQVNLGRTVALKVLAADLAEDETFVKRFLLEARAAAELNHVNLIHINDAGEDDGVFYYTMEFVEGENLAERLKREGPLPVREALDISLQAANALSHAHAKNIIHRDIKPENIMIAADGTVKLADLGLAKKTMDEGMSTITQAGSILGTPHYMAPEQARDFRSADHRSDLYSLGVTLYKMLSGRVPYNGSSPIEVMMKAVEGRPTPIGQLRSDLPAEVEALVARMMHVDPARRFADADALLVALTQLQSDLIS